ncbi:DUF3885 domain-containing protein [Lysinibacillus sp. SGAir0095]|uniref:DUF3885 domain-containing protein n=1 Tax=Lysinibacillus sp. SGAir0095 TaxID=2070463 RepID=UPI0010CCFD78|nr:DUF3885 domain-containing protein [Lysinibacillus sp. SGAir0095]QCR31010.1 hypothetical protein C1N55_01995 [Lysinibacillus sp. SGAir0095]
MKLEDYMEKSFPNLFLTPPLFYNWEIGLRFELGNPKEENDKVYFERVYNRAKTLFSATHQENDELFIVAHDYQLINDKRKGKRTKLFTSFLKEKNLKYNIQHQILPSDRGDDDDICKHQYSLTCQVKDLYHKRLINAFFATNMTWLYFVNVTKGTIFHIYDDRGCDLVATKKEAIQGIYLQYNDWILNYDREKIDEVFK